MQTNATKKGKKPSGGDQSCQLETHLQTLDFPSGEPREALRVACDKLRQRESKKTFKRPYGRTMGLA